MDFILPILLAVFFIHLLVFARLGLKRREFYYLALVVTFTLLCASILLRMFAPELALGSWNLAWVLRVGAWLSALVSISWTLSRILRRRRERQPGD
ncbi:hypothetical protein [Wenzhouxiangella marina]|nr:hypothetical protein [Wenzhouxiangella marina]MBB6086633.1 uncharacterized membrane protein YhaH (DUF805 family) [Wenzhouxiangella marina]